MLTGHRELTTSQYEEISERDMEILNESLEFLCEDLGHGNWEVEYSVRHATHLSLDFSLIQLTK